MTEQFAQENRDVEAFLVQMGSWQSRVEEIRATRKTAREFIDERVSQLVECSKSLTISKAPLKLIPLMADTAMEAKDNTLVASLVLLRDAALTETDERSLQSVVALAGSVRSAVNQGFTKAGACRANGKCQRTHDRISEAFQLADETESLLDRLAVDLASMPTDIDLLTESNLGLSECLGGDSLSLELLDSETLAKAWESLAVVADLESLVKEASGKAHAAAERVRTQDIVRAMKSMDLEVLRKASSADRVRVSPLEASGINNVWDAYKYQESGDLASLPQLGKTSAQAVTQAALRIFEAVRAETPVRIDVKQRKRATLNLLQSLRYWDAIRRVKPSRGERSLARALLSLNHELAGRLQKRGKTPAQRVLAVKYESTDTLAPDLGEMLVSLSNQAALLSRDDDIWTDFLSRPADYFGMITELGFMTEDEKKMHGDLPEEIVEAVRAKELNSDLVTASLRTYQLFGARFALAQEKVVIGDEMGLGKTLEALALIAHLRAAGHSHFLVVCPAGVVSNWIRETSKHTKLTTSRLHGPLLERTNSAKSWIRRGGVAVITYDLLPWAEKYLNDVELGCAIFDEAHYIKNPNAKRSVAAAKIIDSLRFIILMTGTPLENSVEEFRNLIRYIRPDLADEAPEYLAAAFRKHVAPAYLRRNQEDVLTELPELVEIDEWTTLSEVDEIAYRSAVEDGHFMLMRRTAMLSEHSSKVERLCEIVEEAQANGRRVIVFSYFREVLDVAARVLPGRVFGPLTGSLPAAKRQVLIDRFSEYKDGAVLVAQIAAGGVGLNIQSASVVVICEPQLKPTLEAQAIARAHRMGQINTVQVHRLLTENSVDERIREILAEKRWIFDEFARDSAIVKQAPDAVDMSEAELTRLVVAAEKERLLSSPGATIG
ncbi:MAG: DEAD/DEAH box helicase [Microthrixaceae bacterium]|nr:DEAD/DEAH box helicase [Microthrixaceae bacterium]